MSGLAMGAEQAAIAMLRTLGGGRALLMVPQPVTATGQTGLGLVAPLTNAAELEPVLLRTAGANGDGNGLTFFAVTTGVTIRKALGSIGAIAGDDRAMKQTLETSMLQVGGTQYRIVSAMVKWMSGTELLYELEIEE